MKTALTLLAMLCLTVPISPVTISAQAQGSDESYGPKTSLWWPKFHSGQRGSDVEALQMLLGARGTKIKVDGVFGPSTQKAVRAYQKQHGLQVDGVVGWQTWENLVPKVGRGSRGPSVRVLQILLNKNGHRLRVDGVYRVATEKAVGHVEQGIIIPLQNGRVTSSAWCYLVGGHIDGE